MPHRDPNNIIGEVVSHTLPQKQSLQRRVEPGTQQAGHPVLVGKVNSDKGHMARIDARVPEGLSLLGLRGRRIDLEAARRPVTQAIAPRVKPSPKDDEL